MKSKSYGEIAAEDFKTAEYLFDGRLFNPSVKYMQQFVEKCFKEIIVRLGNPESNEDILLLRTHNINSLAKRVEELLGITFSREDNLHFRSLNGLYFTTTYPGDSYEDVDAETATEALEWCRGFKERMRGLQPELCRW